MWEVSDELDLEIIHISSTYRKKSGRQGAHGKISPYD